MTARLLSARSTRGAWTRSGTPAFPSFQHLFLFLSNNQPLVFDIKSSRCDEWGGEVGGLGDQKEPKALNQGLVPA